jgi:predicted nucleic acid-binding protein
VFYAHLDEDDENHAGAERFVREIALTEPLVTSAAVVYETHSLLLRMSRSLASGMPLPAALRFLNQVELMARAVHVTAADYQAGRTLLERLP